MSIKSTLRPGIVAATATILALTGMHAIGNRTNPNAGVDLSASVTAEEPETSTLGPGYLDCDGTRYMTIPHHEDFDIPAGGQMTISARVWLDQYGEHRGILNNRWHSATSSSQGNGSTSGYDIFGGYSATQSMSNNVNLNKGSWNNLGHPWCNTLTTQNWHTVTWVYDGSANTSTMYLDGVQADRRTSSDISNYPINPQCDILVGARYNTGAYPCDVNPSTHWKGKITDVRFYSRALSDTEVAADLTATVDASTEDLIAAYDFRDINGLTVTDISGNGHNGTLVGFPEYTQGSVITIVQPEGGQGTISVLNGENSVADGQRIPDGTELTVQAQPAIGYKLENIKINDTAIEGNTFIVEGPATVSATFTEDTDGPSKVLVFDMNEAGSKYYRIPALEVAADGSLVALADRRGDQLNDLPNTISVIAKRSTDGGRTWSEAVTIAQGDQATGKTYGDPAIVLDRNTGNLVAVFSGDRGFWQSTPSDASHFYTSISSDNGITWSEPRDISSQIRQSGWYGSFAASGSMLQTADGKIMFVANTNLSSAQYLKDIYEFVCCSEDGGQTWTVLNPDSRIPAPGNGNESKLVELPDGSLIMSIRSSGLRRFSKSTDGGRTWSEATAVNGLYNADCNGDIILYPSTDGQTRLLHSAPDNSTTRRDVTVFLSYDEGATWPVKKKIIDGLSAYSSLAVLPDGSIGCLVEEGKWDSNLPGDDGFRLYFMRFTLDWLTDGQDVPATNPDKDVFDGTLNCDGTRYMKIPYNEAFDIAAGGQITISARVRLEQYGAHRGIIHNRWHPFTTKVDDSQRNSDLSGYDLYGGNSASQSLSNNINLNTGNWVNAGHGWCNTLGEKTWQTVTWVFDGQGATSKIYIDGNLVDTKTDARFSSYPINPKSDILVGARYDLGLFPCVPDASSFWLGNIDDVRFFSRALSAEEVTENLTATVDENTPDLIAAYDFSEIIGYNVTDISGHGNTGILVGFPENRVGYSVTIEPAEHGSIQLFDGENEVYNGRKVDAGTELTVVATPDEAYLLESLTLNGEPLEDNTFIVQSNITVAATFVRDPDAPAVYIKPSGNTRADTYVESISTEGATANILAEYDALPAEVFNLVDGTVEARPGESFTLNLKAHSLGDGSTSTVRQDLRYDAAYVFTDWYGTAEFTYQTIYGTLPPANNIYGNYDDVMNISHLLTMPADVAYGTTGRIRVLYSNAWGVPSTDSNIGTGNGGNASVVDPNSQYVVDGVCYDIPVLATELSAIGNIADDPNAPVEYYNLQGIKVSASELLPGIYIRRQGSKTTKIFVSAR